ncbi:PDR/VanB family oxidoreductase [Burkholderia gladioli]|uniref:PDR/VanB family oxidoreductase n=1 Tax=Burkholderia gladioli TaxID=28095 RepID=UPI00139CCF1F|nr:PDR/VanB family oxidoreductase [Burkholderia gladioli]KAF1058391.1 Phenoxybenzoate dioxygenase subunit beta [Burkholderia gladioli]
MKGFLNHEMRPVRLVAIRLAAEQVNIYEFVTLDGSPACAYEPGAHVDLRLTDELVRQYSLLPSAGESLRIAVQTDEAGRGGSRFLARQARVGDVYLVSEARNHFPLVRAACHSVLIAGGIGITPLYGMLAELEREGASWELHYAVRSEAKAVFGKALRAYGEKVRILRSDRPEDGRLDMARVVEAAPAGSEFYCCGPGRMMDAFCEATAGRPPERVHLERFSAATEIAAEGGFEVRLERSGKQLFVARGQTILQTLREAGLAMPSSCEQGVCGVCESRVLCGEPDHRDHVLSAAERAKGDTMMICCSGSRGPLLVLDL